MKLTAIDLIAIERERQIVHEGWTPDHDDRHDSNELAWAAIFYADPSMSLEVHPSGWRGIFQKRAEKTRIRRLVVAGALIAAEIERLQRAEEGPRMLLSEGPAS